MLIENDRRKRVERRLALSGPPENLGERRKALQRRVLDIGVMSFDRWMGKRSAGSGAHHRIELVPSLAGSETLAAGLF